MSEKKLQFNCKIYLEAEDISQSRILSTAAYVKKLLQGSQNPYIAGIQIDNESDMEDFIFRLYLEADKTEERCSDEESADMLAPQIAEVLSEIAQAHSYLDMEGDFTVNFNGKMESYRFASESGNSFCDFYEK